MKIQQVSATRMADAITPCRQQQNALQATDKRTNGQTDIQTGQRHRVSIKLLPNNVEFEKGHACKYLGIYLDDQLNWKHHVDYICEKLVKFTGIFYRLRSKISCEWLRNIYYSFEYPHLLYGIEMYANTCVTYLDKLIELNNKVLRILKDL